MEKSESSLHLRIFSFSSLHHRVCLCIFLSNHKLNSIMDAEMPLKWALSCDLRKMAQTTHHPEAGAEEGKWLE